MEYIIKVQIPTDQDSLFKEAMCAGDTPSLALASETVKQLIVNHVRAYHGNARLLKQNAVIEKAKQAYEAVIAEENAKLDDTAVTIK